MLSFYLTLLDNPDDKTLFSTLYAQYRSLLFNIANSILKDSHLAEDAVQSTFLSLAKNFSKISGRSCNQIRNYMIIIVRNTSLQIYNKKKKEICADDELTCISDNSDIEADTENRDSEKQLFELVKELDPKYSDVLMLRYFYDMPNREISSLLGISQNNVNIRLMRGRDMLRKKLKEESANDRFSV